MENKMALIENTNDSFVDKNYVNGLFMNMDNNLGEIDSFIEIAGGGLSFLYDIIDEMEQYPDAAASRVKVGEVPKKLRALYILLQHSVENINKARLHADTNVNEYFEKEKEYSADVRNPR